MPSSAFTKNLSPSHLAPLPTSFSLHPCRIFIVFVVSMKNFSNVLNSSLNAESTWQQWVRWKTREKFLRGNDAQRKTFLPERKKRLRDRMHDFLGRFQGKSERWKLLFHFHIIRPFIRFSSFSFVSGFFKAENGQQSAFWLTNEPGNLHRPLQDVYVR